MTASDPAGVDALSALLRTLQHGDSFFPSGAVAFSYGLETLCADGHVTTAAEVERFLWGQLRGRWAPCDRGVLVAAFRAGDDLEGVQRADALQEAVTLPRELREGSWRAGAALLRVHAELGTRNATAFQERVSAGRSPGHLPAVQGLVWRGVMLGEEQAGAAGAHGLCVALLGAALRLGVIGHVGAQRLLTGLRPALVDLLATPPPALDDVHGFAPLAEVAVMRHESQMSRLFAS